MKRIILAAAAAGLIVPLGLARPAIADPGDYAKKQWEKRADCDKKLYEAKSARDFYKTAAECNRELAKLSREQRKEAAKAWREAEKKWRWPNYDGPVFEWDD